MLDNEKVHYPNPTQQFTILHIRWKKKNLTKFATKMNKI